MDRSTTHFWHAKLSQIYTTLKTLEKDGSVTSTLETQQDRPDRRVYTITPHGKQLLQQWLAQPETDLSPKKETLVLKLFFSAQLDRQTVLTQLRLQRDLHRQQMTHYRDVGSQDIQQVVDDHPELAKDAVLWEATRQFGEMYEELYVRWLEETIQLIHDSGGIAVAPHPYSFYKSPPTRKVGCYDAVEVINAASVPFSVLTYFSKRFAEGLGLPQIGGSDSHYAPEIGSAYSVVDSEVNVDEIVSAIKKGNVAASGRGVPWKIKFERATSRMKRNL